MEKQFHFHSENLQLEGLINEQSREKSVIVTHPHPLYGGDMHNAVVDAICDAYGEKGFTTMRFNFRGVGASEGRYDDGVGEKRDVLSALKHFKDMGFKQVDRAGYSFGAWINACAGCADTCSQDMILVSPPVALLDFTAISDLSCLKLVVTGSLDDIAPPDQIEPLLPVWNASATFEQINGADHFYGGHFSALKTAITRHI